MACCWRRRPGWKAAASASSGWTTAGCSASGSTSTQREGSSRVETYAPGERLLWSAAYGDFRQVGDIDFAHEISLWFPSSQTQVQLVFKQVELNPALPEGVFTLQLPSARWCPARTGAAA